MKIAVDARELVGRPTGVGRYLGELLAEWSESQEALRHDWVLYAPAPVSVPSRFASAVRIVPGGSGTMWEQWRLPRALADDGPDTLFAPGYTAPLRCSCPVVQTIHDVAFSAHPEWFSFREGARRRTLTRLSAGRARTILTDTAFSRAEIVRHLQVPPSLVRVVPPGVRGRPGIEVSERASREPRVLFVGSIFARRHVDALVQAFATQVAPRFPTSRLDIVGENRSYPRVDLEQVLARQSGDVRGRIAIRSYVEEGTLTDLYTQAALFVFPSEYEGFGFTPLEALACGVAPIVLDTAVGREVYGPAVHYVPHTEALAEQLGAAMVHLLASDEARLELLRHAPCVLARYRWDAAAAATLAAVTEGARG